MLRAWLVVERPVPLGGFQPHKSVYWRLSQPLLGSVPSSVALLIVTVPRWGNAFTSRTRKHHSVGNTKASVVSVRSGQPIDSIRRVERSGDGDTGGGEWHRGEGPWLRFAYTTCRRAGARVEAGRCKARHWWRSLCCRSSLGMQSPAWRSARTRLTGPPCRPPRGGACQDRGPDGRSAAS